MCVMTLRAVAIVPNARRAPRWGMVRRPLSGVRGKFSGGEAWEVDCVRRRGDEPLDWMGLGRVENSRDVVSTCVDFEGRGPTKILEELEVHWILIEIQHRESNVFCVPYYLFDTCTLL